MKISILTYAMLVAITPITLSAQARLGEGSLNDPIGSANSAQHDKVLTDVLTTPAAVPRGPKELLQDYEAEMTAITQSFSATLTGITTAVQSSQLTSEQGQTIATEQYQLAQMQFELLAAWHAMLEQDLARATIPAAKATPVAVEGNQIVTVPLPFSSFLLDSSVEQYLRLSESQAQAIQQLMLRERRDLEPLIAQMRTTREKLLAADPERSSQKDIKALAGTEAGLMAKLIVANARMQSKIYKLLTPEQQLKLDEFKRSSESAGILSR